MGRSLHSRKKQHARQVEAFQDGILLPEEKTPTLATEAAEREATARKTQNANARLKTRKLAAYHGSKATLTGMAVFVDPKLQHTLAAKLAPLQLQEVPRDKADVLVVADPAHPGQRALCTAALRGAFIVGPLLDSGPIIKYEQYMSRTRSVFVTDGFKASHAMLYDLITKCTASSKWKWIHTAADHTAAQAQAATRRRPAEVIALGTRDDLRTMLAGRTHTFTSETFLASIANIDAAHSWGVTQQESRTKKQTRAVIMVSDHGQRSWSAIVVGCLLSTQW